jgi:hypothetical protein
MPAPLMIFEQTTMWSIILVEQSLASMWRSSGILLNNKREYSKRLEDWETLLLKINDPNAEQKLAEKYKGLHLIDSETLYNVLSNLESNEDRINRGWMVFIVPPEYSGDGADGHLNDGMAGMIGDYSQGGHVNAIAIANRKEENNN